MEKLGLNELREKYLSFFESKGHLRLPSFSLVPQNDASLLLINAGMAPLKPYFTGKEIPPRKRVTTCQKCIRTPDIERVGKTARHGTFFEMLGNFSFGDYFKHEVTDWAWEFITKELELPVDRLYVSVYESDDEAYDIWVNERGVDPSHMVRFGKEDNFWEIGTGPCGPCSEIYFDRGEKYGCGKPDCKVGCDCDRFVEFWNLVFTQFDKDEDGNYNPLEHPNIDTGMGLERLAVIMQDVGNLFEVDTVRNIMLEICKIAGVNYKENEKSDISLRVITDHIRSTVFMISDGISPSNEGRGYVLRRLLRRAARHGKLLGIKEPFLHKIVATVVNENKSAYPELAEKQEYITKMVINEEDSFNKTIDQGLAILEDYIKHSDKILSGEDAFRLYDTYGFPIDLTMEILEEHNLDVDLDSFNALLNEQKTRSRENRNVGESAGWDDGVFSQLGNEPTEFIGYDSHSCDALISAIIKDGKIVSEIKAGDTATVILDKTVFYGESGGQAGDNGAIISGDAVIEISDTKKLANGKILHEGTVKGGAFKSGDAVTCVINEEKRNATARNHSATHLLQRALRDELGTHAHQSGSSVDENGLRFDFTHFAAVTEDELKRVERAVNEAILEAMPIDISYQSVDEAKKSGAMALFDSKYGDTVRVVKMGDYSTELCGGCHLKNTAEAGLFKIVKESGISTGVRRIEAVTGFKVLQLLENAEAKLSEVAEVLKTSPADVVKKAEGLTAELKAAKTESDKLRAKLAGSSVDSLLESAVDVSGVLVVTGRFDDMDVEGLRATGDKIKEKAEKVVVLLASASSDKVTFVAMASKAAVASGANAGNLVREAAKITGGGGGGRPDSAQAGGKNPAKTDEALCSAVEIVKTQIS